MKGAGKRKRVGGKSGPAQRIEARGSFCPVPTVMAALALETAEPGALIDLLADDPVTRRDLVSWCGEFGHRVLHIRDLRKGFCVRIQKNKTT